MCHRLGDILEILAQIYGLITGPPAWRKSLSTNFKHLVFKRHPLAPCLALLCEGEEEKLSGVIVV